MIRENNKKGMHKMSQASRNYSEKRDFIRMQVSTATEIHHKGDIFSATCIDLSSNGALITSETSFEVNSEVILSINSGGGETPPLQAQATVLRVKRLENSQYQYGMTINSFV
jgi:hypothetical protein